MRELVVAEVERTAAMREPAHDDAVRRDQLLAVNAEVLPPLLRPARDGQPPGDERPGIPGPARLHWQLAQVDGASFVHDLLAGRRRALLRRHVEHALEHRKLVPQVAQPGRRLRLFEVREHLADFTQLGGVFRAHRRRDARHRAEEIGKHRRVVARRALEKQRRPARAQHAVADLGDLEAR